MIVINVLHRCKPGMRDKFLELLEKEGIGAASRADEGNIKYDYYLPADGSDELLLVEKWENAESLAKHMKQPHLAKLRGLQPDYVESAEFDKFEVE